MKLRINDNTKEIAKKHEPEQLNVFCLMFECNRLRKIVEDNEEMIKKRLGLEK